MKVIWASKAKTQQEIDELLYDAFLLARLRSAGQDSSWLTRQSEQTLPRMSADTGKTTRQDSNG